MRIISVMLGVFLIFGGFSMMVTPGLTFLSVGWIVGFLFLMAGINSIIDFVRHRKEGHITKWDLLGGILSLVFGLLILMSPYVMVIAKIMTVYVFNFWLIASGILRIVAALEAKKNGSKGWIWVLILAILTVVLGVYALFNILVTAVAMGWMLGFFVLMSGFNLISAGTMYGKNENAPF